MIQLFLLISYIHIPLRDSIQVIWFFSILIHLFCDQFRLCSGSSLIKHHPIYNCNYADVVVVAVIDLLAVKICPSSHILPYFYSFAIV